MKVGRGLPTYSRRAGQAVNLGASVGGFCARTRKSSRELGSGGEFSGEEKAKTPALTPKAGAPDGTLGHRVVLLVGVWGILRPAHPSGTERPKSGYPESLAGVGERGGFFEGAGKVESLGLQRTDRLRTLQSGEATVLRLGFGVR